MMEGRSLRTENEAAGDQTEGRLQRQTDFYDLTEAQAKWDQAVVLDHY